MPRWSQWGRSCRFPPDDNKFFVHYGKFTIWLCHSELKLYWNYANSAMSARLHMPIVSWRVMRALTLVGYWGRIRIFMFTVSWRLHKLLWYFTSLHANTIALLPIKKMSKFYIFTFCSLWISIDIGNLKGCSLFLATEPWLLDQNIWYFTYLKKSHPASFLFEEIPTFSTYCGFYSLPKKIYKRLSKSVHISN